MRPTQGSGPPKQSDPSLCWPQSSQTRRLSGSSVAVQKLAPSGASTGKVLATITHHLTLDPQQVGVVPAGAALAAVSAVRAAAAAWGCPHLRKRLWIHAAQSGGVGQRHELAAGQEFHMSSLTMDGGLSAPRLPAVAKPELVGPPILLMARSVACIPVSPTGGPSVEHPVEVPARGAVAGLPPPDACAGAGEPPCRRRMCFQGKTIPSRKAKPLPRMIRCHRLRERAETNSGDERRGEPFRTQTAFPSLASTASRRRDFTPR